MKFHQLLAGAAVLLLAASQAQATASPEVRQYAERAESKADALLRAAGLDPASLSVAVRAGVAADGHLTGLRVVRSSGSADTDHAVETVLRKIVVTDAPIGLIGGAVTLNLGEAAGAAAATR